MLFVRNPTGVSHSPERVRRGRRLRGRCRGPGRGRPGARRERRVPAFANCHSHAFHRALRGRVTGADSFWRWRDRCTRSPACSTPTCCSTSPRATYAEMRLAGIRAVGEFHYLHHRPDGTPYDDPNAMGEALIAAAREAGIRITLLDTCYLAAGLRAGRPRVSSGGSATATPRPGPHGSRRSPRSIAGADDVVIGAAIHSVRAVPARPAGDRGRRPCPTRRCTSTSPSSRPRTQECLAATGLTPVALLAEAGVWTPRTHRGPRDPPDRRRHRDARRSAVLRLLLPDDRGRARRRHRPERRAARCRRAADTGLGQQHRDRHVRRGPRRRDARTARDRASAAPGPPSQLLGGRDRRPATSRSASPPATDRGSTSTRCGRPARVEPLWAATAADVVAGARPGRRRRAPRRRAIDACWEPGMTSACWSPTSASS